MDCSGVKKSSDREKKETMLYFVECEGSKFFSRIKMSQLSRHHKYAVILLIDMKFYERATSDLLKTFCDETENINNKI